MCLIAFEFDAHSEYALILAANRDEFYRRPTLPAGFWPDEPHVLAGRDAKAGGTWMGITKTGHWAAITNVRDLDNLQEHAPSRGHLVRDYLVETPDPEAFARDLEAKKGDYNGFNLLVGTPDALWSVSTHAEGPMKVEPGLHGLSNATLDTPWPKVERATQKLEAAIQNGTVEPERLLEMLDDRTQAPDEALPDTGVGLEKERMLSPMLITSSEYGTRSSTVLTIRRDGTVSFVEKTYVRGTEGRTREFGFEISG